MSTLRNITGRLARIERARQEDADAARAGMATLSDADLHLMILDSLETEQSLPTDPYDRYLTVYALDAILQGAYSVPPTHARAVEVARRLGIDHALIAEANEIFPSMFAGRS